MKNKKFNLVIVFLSILYILFIILNTFSNMSFLERGDNYFEILSAKGILKYDLKPLGDFDIFMQKNQVVLNHPPFFSYILALFLFIFKSAAVLNFFSVFIVLITGFLLLKISKLIFKDISSLSLILIYILFLFIPLIMQGSYLVDREALLAFFMLLFTYFYLKKPNRIILNSLLFMLIWLVKIQGVPIIILSLFLYLLISKKPKKDYITGILIVSIGSILFFIIMFSYGLLVGIGFSRVFAHSSILDIIRRQVANPEKTLLTSIWSVKQLLIWVVPSSILLYIVSIYSFLKNRVWKKNEKLLLPILISVIILVELIPIGTYGWNFPKYYASFVPFMLLSVVPIIRNINFKKRELYKIFILLLITIAYFLIIPDPYLPEVNEAFTQKQYFPLMARVLFNLDLLILPILFVFIAYSKKINKEKILKILLISSLVIALSVGIMQISKPYSTNNIYGDSHADLEETIDYLKENTNVSDRIVAFNHVGYYFGNEDNSNWYNSVLCYSEACINNLEEEVKFIQAYPKDLERLDGRFRLAIEEQFNFDRRFGDYLIYRRKER